MRTVYVDNNATTQIAPEVIEGMLPFLHYMWGNPSSMHTFGGQVARYIDEARENIAELIGAQNPNEIIITSCGTESDNTAIRSAIQSRPDKRHLLTTSVEHPAVLNLVKEFEKKGYGATYLKVDELGRLDISEFEKSLTPDTAIISVMWANNETGVIFPIEKIAEICHERKIPLHVDAVQAVGKIPINLSKTPINYLSLSGHKLHAPKGIGALYVRKGTSFSPWLIGGHQEKGRRGGTENVASIVGLGIACKLAAGNIKNEEKYLSALRDRLEKEILEKIPNSYVHGDTRNRLPNTTNIGFESVEGEAILLMMNEFNICASSGSACTSGALDPSHVMMAMGIPFTRAHGSIRFSLSRYNTEKDIEIILEKLPGIIKHLRDLSPFA